MFFFPKMFLVAAIAASLISENQSSLTQWNNFNPESESEIRNNRFMTHKLSKKRQLSPSLTCLDAKLEFLFSK